MPEISRKIFANNLRYYMKIMGKEIQDLARAADTSPRSVENHLAGRNMPRAKTLHAYANELGVAVTALTVGQKQPSLAKGRLDVLADSEGLYGRTEEKTLDGIRHSITVFEPKGEITAAGGSNEISTVDRLVNMVSRKDDEIRELKVGNQALETTLNKVLKILTNHARPPEQERRSMMTEIFRAFDGNEFLKSR